MTWYGLLTTKGFRTDIRMSRSAKIPSTAFLRIISAFFRTYKNIKEQFKRFLIIQLVNLTRLSILMVSISYNTIAGLNNTSFILQLQEWIHAFCMHCLITQFAKSISLALFLQSNYLIHFGLRKLTLIANKSPVDLFWARKTRPNAPLLIGFIISKSSIEVLSLEKPLIGLARRLRIVSSSTELSSSAMLFDDSALSSCICSQRVKYFSLYGAEDFKHYYDSSKRKKSQKMGTQFSVYTT